jgi:uncharacterized membrane protein
MRLLHVGAGLLALLSGAVALYSLKGARLHRKSGLVFVGAMLVMSSSGALIAVVQPNVIALNVIAGVLTFYFVLTALRTVRRPVPEAQRLDTLATLAALTTGLASFALGLAAAAGPEVRADPAAIYFMFGVIAVLSVLGDFRILRGRPLQDQRRITRHLWRMCFALFIAAGSFFLGPPQRLPASMRGAGWLPIPVLMVLLTMAFWLVRVRLSQQFRHSAPA